MWKISIDETGLVDGFYPPDYQGVLPEETTLVDVEEEEKDRICSIMPAYYDANEQTFKHWTPAYTLEDLKAWKKAEIASARYEHEIAGVIINGIHITTDREDQAMITAVALSAVVDPAYTTVWKGADGYLDLDAAGVLTLARMVGAHVEAAFAEEKRLVEQIDAAQDEAELASIVWTLT